MSVLQSTPGSMTGVAFENADDIDNWFINRKGQDFVSWFNARIGNQGFWGKVGSRAGISIANDSQSHERFSQLWNTQTINAMFDSGTISLLQFIALQSIVTNETGGQLLPLTEKVGSKEHPGIAYAFDRIPNLKRSYNTLAGNKTCFELFNDKSYNTAFGSLALGSQLKNTTDKVWAGEVYPQTVSTSTNPLQSGYVLEADFFKFRGRGFIQTTGRNNYKNLVAYVMAYKGTCSTLVATRDKWSKLSNDIDAIASLSTNADWDTLFQKGDCLVAGRAIHLHNMASGNYLNKLTQTNTEDARNAIFNMGLRISGGKDYATLFQNRVQQIMDAIQRQ